MALKGKVAIVTGSSSGIGAATAKLFAKEGAKVTLTARSADKLNEVASGCGKGNYHVVIGDICDETIMKKIVDETVEKFGKIDILINNAGTNIVSPVDTGIDNSLIPSMMGKFFGISAYDEQFKVNVRPVVGMCTLAVPHLIKSKGCIVNVSSGASKRPVPGSTVYCMSKSALDMLTCCLCVELGPLGVRVNAINPGLIKTNFVPHITGLTYEQMGAHMQVLIDKHPLKRIGEAEECARGILFLVDDKMSSFITGQTLGIDGGVVHSV